METKISPVDVDNALREYLKNNEGKICYKLQNHPGKVIKFLLDRIKGSLKEGDFGEGFNYSISNAPCTVSIQESENYRTPNDLRFDCTLRLSCKTDGAGKMEIVCEEIKDNTIYIKKLY